MPTMSKDYITLFDGTATGATTTGDWVEMPNFAFAPTALEIIDTGLVGTVNVEVETAVNASSTAATIDQLDIVNGVTAYEFVESSGWTTTLVRRYCRVEVTGTGTATSLTVRLWGQQERG